MGLVIHAIIKGQNRFFILDLNLHHIRLFDCTQYSISPVKIDDFIPLSIKKVQLSSRSNQLQFHGNDKNGHFHGQGGQKMRRQKETEKLYTMTFLKNNILVLIVLLFFLSQNSQSQDNNESPTLFDKELALIGFDVLTFSNYCNGRFNFCVQYPSELFLTTPPPSNNDGRTFISKDGTIQLIVFGTYQLHWTLPETFDMALHAIKSQQTESDWMSSQILGKQYFEISGTVEGNYYYRKTFKRNHQFITLIFESAFAPLKAELIEEVREEIINSFAR